MYCIVWLGVVDGMGLIQYHHQVSVLVCGYLDLRRPSQRLCIGVRVVIY